MTEATLIFIGTLVIAGPALWFGWKLPDWIKVLKNKQGSSQ